MLSGWARNVKRYANTPCATCDISERAEKSSTTLTSCWKNVVFIRFTSQVLTRSGDGNGDEPDDDVRQAGDRVRAARHMAEGRQAHGKCARSQTA